MIEWSDYTKLNDLAASIANEKREAEKNSTSYDYNETKLSSFASNKGNEDGRTSQ
jgi:hypothetical protein